MRIAVLLLLLACLPMAGFGDAPAPPSGKTLRIYSNNVGIFPAFIHQFYPEQLKEKKADRIADETRRAEALVQSLLDAPQPPDVILLQEIWSLKARDALIAGLAAAYPYCEHPAEIGIAPMATQMAGLMIFSRYPLSDFRFTRFSRGIGIDKMSGKGIAGARLRVDGREIALFTTHLQAGGKRDPSVQIDQLRECNALLQSYREADSDLLCVLAGDFNIDSTETAAYDEMLRLLEGSRDTFRASASELKRTTRKVELPEKRIDYLLAIGEAEVYSTIVDLTGDAISDHIGVYGIVTLGE